MQVTQPNISIIIPCRNEVDYIEKCLDSVLVQTESLDGISIEILVADGMSNDGTRAVIEGIMVKEPGVRLIDNPGLIASTGLNRAIKTAAGGIIIRMDVHTEYAPDYVAKCLELLESTNAWNVGGPARTKAKGYLQEAVRLAYHSPFQLGGPVFMTRTTKVLSTPSPTVAGKRPLWRRSAYLTKTCTQPGRRTKFAHNA